MLIEGRGVSREPSVRLRVTRGRNGVLLWKRLSPHVNSLMLKINKLIHFVRTFLINCSKEGDGSDEDERKGAEGMKGGSINDQQEIVFS